MTKEVTKTVKVPVGLRVGPGGTTFGCNQAVVPSAAGQESPWVSPKVSPFGGRTKDLYEEEQVCD